MHNYQKEYFILFNAITDALRQLEEQNLGAAKKLLMTAQQQAEEHFLSEKED